jgi:hypothetical protein
MPFRKFSSRSFEYKSKNVELQEEEIHGSLLSVRRKAVVVLQGLVRDIINTRRLSIEQRGKRQSIQVNRGPVDIAPRSSNPTAHSRTRRAGVHDLHRDLLSRRSNRQRPSCGYRRTKFHNRHPRQPYTCWPFDHLSHTRPCYRPSTVCLFARDSSHCLWVLTCPTEALLRGCVAKE